jgi:hypothetical protein
MKLSPIYRSGLLPCLPQFSMRSVLLAMVIVSALFAVMAAIGLMWSTVLVWVALLIAGHVLGNSWGSQAFGARGVPTLPAAMHEEISEWTLPAQLPIPQRAATQPTRIYSSAELQLQQRSRIVVCAGSALFLGVIGGGAATALFWRDACVSAVLVWCGSFAVVGAILGFVVGGFLQVLNEVAERAPDSI